MPEAATLAKTTQEPATAIGEIASDEAALEPAGQVPLQWGLDKAAFDGDVKLVRQLLAITSVGKRREALRAAIQSAEAATTCYPSKAVQYEAIIEKLQGLFVS